LTDASFLDAPLLVPPDQDQAAIVRFLRHANRLILRYILARQKLIKLLEEQKQVIIQQLVTRGLNQGVRLKALSQQLSIEVPEHWQVLQVRRLVSTVTSGSRGWATYYSDEGDVFLQSGNLGRSMSLNLAKVQHVQLPPNAEGVRTEVRRNDLLICITGALTGNVVIVDTDLTQTYVNQHVALVRPRQDAVEPRFLAYCLYSLIGQAQFKASEYGGTKQGLGLDEVKSALVPLPLRSEQTLIVKTLDEQLATLSLSIEKVFREMSLVREYRTSLIAEVVTGKVDVRKAAADLADEVEDADELPLEDEALEDADDAELSSDEPTEEGVIA
jgi:type I restriction enzyme S subunit